LRRASFSSNWVGNRPVRAKSASRRPKRDGRTNPSATASPITESADHQAPPDAHEWLTFDDEDELRTWSFDVTFLMSPWNCIFGNGCQGVLTGPTPELEQGCCSYGAHFTDDDDVARVEAAAATLDPSEWQFAKRAKRGGFLRKEADGTRVTRLVDEACIFLNRPGFPGGAGCALHRAAIARDAEPMTLKPDVCWQLPLRREDTTDDSGRVTSVVGQWERRHWGDGGMEFHWWCTESSEAFTAPDPLYLRLVPELRGLVGERTHARLVEYLDARLERGQPLPHPVVRARDTSP
jgi:hypothetical protein